jgi:hypothetical protein
MISFQILHLLVKLFYAGFQTYKSISDEFYEYLSIYLKLSPKLQLFSFYISPIMILLSSLFPLIQIILGILFYTSNSTSLYVVWGFVSMAVGLMNFIFLACIFLIKFVLWKVGQFQNKLKE